MQPEADKLIISWNNPSPRRSFVSFRQPHSYLSQFTEEEKDLL